MKAASGNWIASGLIRAEGQSQPMLVHQRTMKMEIAVHEYWSNDGQWI